VSSAVLGAVLIFFAIAAVIGVFIIIVVANRADPDPSGRRPLVVYYFGVSFFAVFAVLFGSFGIVTALVQLIGSHSGSAGGAIHPIGDAVARSVVLSGIVTAVGGTLLYTHLPRGLGLSGGADARRGPAGRVAQSYAAAVAFVSVAVAAASSIVLVYEVVQILGPGVFLLSGTRVDGSRIALPALYLALASGLLAVAHIRLLPPDVRGFSPLSRRTAPSGGGTSAGPPGTGVPGGPEVQAAPAAAPPFQPGVAPPAWGPGGPDPVPAPPPIWSSTPGAAEPFGPPQ
jgi:hypothetical protein